MVDIVVTTPKNRMKEAAQEAAYALASPATVFYFRKLGRMPDVKVGDRVYYVEDGYVRGFAIVDHFRQSIAGEICETTRTVWAGGWFVFMRADSWQWIEPWEMQGFMGFRYAKHLRDFVKVIGDWRMPKP